MTVEASDGSTVRFRLIGEPPVDDCLEGARQLVFPTSAAGERVVRGATLRNTCATPVVGIDLHADVGGDVQPHLVPFTSKQNLALIRTAYTKTPFLAGRPESDHRKAAQHADKARCVVAGTRPAHTESAGTP